MPVAGIAALLYAGFQALAAIPTIITQMESLASAITLWYLNRQTTEQLQAISDAAALAGRATTDEERYAAAQNWRTVLSAPRVTAS